MTDSGHASGVKNTAVCICRFGLNVRNAGRDLSRMKADGTKPMTSALPNNGDVRARSPSQTFGGAIRPTLIQSIPELHEGHAQVLKQDNAAAD